MKTNTKLNKTAVALRWAAFVTILVVIFVIVIGHSKKTVGPDVQEKVSKVEWKKRLLHEIYPPGTATNDIVKDTIDRLNVLSMFIKREIGNDANLLRLVEAERRVALTPDQLSHDLMGLDGMELDFIGQFHESLDSAGYPIREIQVDIAQMVRERYDVMWTEDFTGGSVVDIKNIYERIMAESAESDLVSLRALNHVEVTVKYVHASIPLHASFQLVFEPRAGIQVRGADYHPIKAIQQHFMEYELPTNVRGPVPLIMTPEQKEFVMSLLSDARDLYVLREIALRADRDKRNVLVLGTYHANHVSYLMARYGVRSTLYLPVVRQ